MDTRGQRPLRVGDVVSICKPTSTLRKVTYQWTEPQFIVTLVTTATVTVRDLGSKKGAKLSKIAKQGLPSTIVNRKMTRAYPVKEQFFVGATVARRFAGKWFLGKVTKVFVDEDETHWHVVYSDFDEDDLAKGELAQALVYHPSLDAGEEQEPPPVDSFVWFSEAQNPRLGRVLSVDRSVP